MSPEQRLFRQTTCNHPCNGQVCQEHELVLSASIRSSATHLLDKDVGVGLAVLEAVGGFTLIIELEQHLVFTAHHGAIV
jgi:hypothetical protein